MGMLLSGVQKRRRILVRGFVFGGTSRWRCVEKRRPVGRVMADRVKVDLLREVGVLGIKVDPGVNGGRGRRGVREEMGRVGRSLVRERGDLRLVGREVGALELRVGRDVNLGRGRKGVAEERGHVGQSLVRARVLLRGVGREVGALGIRADRGVNGGRGRRGVTVERGHVGRSLVDVRAGLRPVGREEGALEIRVDRGVNLGRGRRGVEAEMRRKGLSSDRSLVRVIGALQIADRDVNLSRGRKGVTEEKGRVEASSGRSLGLVMVGRGVRMLPGEPSLSHVEIGSLAKRDVVEAMRSRGPCGPPRPRVGCAAGTCLCV